MKRITADQTALAGLSPELTPDVILSGERVEIDPAEKLNRKEKYVLYSFAESIINAYAEDLLAAYQAIEALEQENEDVSKELADMTKAAETCNAQLKKVLAGEKAFADAEKLLARFEQQMDTLAKDKQVNESTIASLRSQVKDLVKLKEEVPQLKEDVNAVLQLLRSYFDEAGIEAPDFSDMYNDDYDE